jgi:hypothetical protein
MSGSLASLSPGNASEVSDFLQQVVDRSTRLAELVASLTAGTTIALVLGTLFLLSAFTRPKRHIPGAPVLGRKHWWEPDLLLYWRYTANARTIIADGYKKVREQQIHLRNCGGLDC